MKYTVQSGDKIHGEFDSYDEAIALWRKIYKRDKAVVIKDNK